MTDNDTKKCPFCGATIPSYVERCSYCGIKQPSKYIKINVAGEADEEYNYDKPKYQNYGIPILTQCYLWLGIVVNSLILLLIIEPFVENIGLWSGTPEPLPLRLYWVTVTLLNISSNILLLYRLKLGFKIAIIVVILNCIYSIVKGAIIPSSYSAIGIISPLIALLIMYGVLHLKKNGVVFWDTLR